ncbi:MAG: hypothetical protein KF753_20705 [Caldilineaceae bacterium]|nr:hypothetical protein [Caldilineaceae bacterium]
MTKRTKGICRLCGELTTLSFEHIPPKSAFNDQPLVFQTLQDRIQGRSHTKFRIALGNHSLCERCNNLTGAWYGAAYVSWARQGFEWLDYLGENSSIQIPFRIMPLNVLKQIIVMTLAMSGEGTIPYHTELRRFVLNREQKYLPPHYNVYSYFTATSKPRFESGMVVFDARNGSMNHIDAELAFPPFGYCLTSTRRQKRRSNAIEKGLYDIGWFSHFNYNLWTTVYLKMPKLQTHTPFPLDYRTPEQIAVEALNSGE